jgi:hypothetical protein
MLDVADVEAELLISGNTITINVFKTAEACRDQGLHGFSARGPRVGP